MVEVKGNSQEIGGGRSNQKGSGGSEVAVNGLCKSYGNIVAVNDVSFSVGKGNFLTILGPSGSGKTTTLMMLAGFESPETGSIYVDGMDVTTIPPHQRDLGMVFQNYALFPHMTVYDNVGFPLKMRKADKKTVKKNVARALEIVQLRDVNSRHPQQLSGGQQQRVAIARCLAFNPRVLLLDEPLGALDKKLREHMQIEIKHLQERLGITVIYVTHDQEEALVMSDKIVVMNNGKIEQIGSPDDIYDSPANAFVAEFIGKTNLITGILHLGSEMPSISLLNVEVPITPATLSENLCDGSQVCLFIRPERIQIDQGDKTDANLLPGVVEERIFLGDSTTFILRISPEIVLSMKVPNTHELQVYEQGQKLNIAFRREDVRVMEASL